jgi:Putative beta-barrel porin-2, OmpL-like. bbp2
VKPAQAKVLLALGLLFPALPSHAKEGVTFDGFVDTYYAYDFNHLSNFDRSFTTQPARSDEFNVNLAYAGASYLQDRVRGRFALQAGTSVQNNYAGEPTNGAVSGPSLSRSIQEAYVGYRLTDQLWLDAGTYFSHVGAEGFISRDNPTYTRSLVADFSPYYQSGVRLSYQASEKLALQLHVVNGWQNISENNHSKMLGTQISYQLTPHSTLAYSTLIGREAEFRHFHDLVYKFTGEQFDFVAQYDVGFQNLADGSGVGNWWGGLGVLRYKIGPTQAVALRAEHYADPHQFIINTSLPASFETSGGSIGFDQDLSSQLKWRSEYRLMSSRSAVYPDGSDVSTMNHLAVTSLALSL